MKKMLAAAVTLIFTAGILKAQDAPVMQDAVVGSPSTTVTETDKARKAEMVAADCDMKNCCTMREGKMYSIKGGKEIPMTADMKLANGDAVMMDGTIVRVDGNKSTLKDGYCIDMNGNMGRIAQPAKSTDPTQKADSPPADKSKK